MFLHVQLKSEIKLFDFEIVSIIFWSARYITNGIKVLKHNT